MTIIKHPVDLGIPDPSLNTSPIIDTINEEQFVIESQVPEERRCYFNGQSYPHDTQIKSDGRILICDRGAWANISPPDQHQND